VARRAVLEDHAALALFDADEFPLRDLLSRIRSGGGQPVEWAIGTAEAPSVGLDGR
jgi:hypothetical protein